MLADEENNQTESSGEVPKTGINNNFKTKNLKIIFIS